jgi:hypothetical protein
MGPDSGDAKLPSRCTPLLGLHGNIPTFIRVTDSKMHDVNMLDEIEKLGPSMSWIAATSTSNDYSR